ncbi:peptidylprolyl isomerase [Planctomicrobium sp. SH668]|uniref:peptidylprolyl isomerase n=1 Tax=Planctomicrobium sp. SH668 TaxID=3448126 RepID=UPI003F5C0FD6
MSERIHSSQPAATQKNRRAYWPAVTGTVVLLAVAGIWLQFFRAQPGISQTNSNQPGKAALETAPAATSARPLAKVNGQAINYDVVARECVARYGNEILDSLISRLIIQQECEARGIVVTVAEIDDEISKTAKKFNLPVDTWYKMLEAERKLNRDQYQQDVIWPMLALKKLAGQNIEITEADMQKGFESNYGPRVKARMIMVSGNIRNANSIWEQCKANPDDFDRLAREYSADPNSRPLGGTIPPIRRHGGDKQIEDQAFKMHIGEISPVIQLPNVENRYVILKCEGFTEPVVTDIKEVWSDLYAQLTEEKIQTSVAKVYEDIKSRARVDNFLTNTSTGGRNVQQASGLAASPIDKVGVQPASATATR